MKVIITIPAYNEENTLGKVLEEIKHVMKGTKYDYSLLVVDDGSKDRTVAVAKKAGAEVISNPRNLGLAETFRREMEACLERQAEVIVHTDADGQYPAQYIPALLQKIEQGNDLVLGSRFGKGRYAGSLTKKLGNIGFAKVFSSLLKTKLSDTATGFRAFTWEVASLPLINTFTYTMEQLIRAGKANMKIAEVPIRCRRTRPSKLFKNPFIYGLKQVMNLLRIYRDFAPMKFFCTMGMILFVPGFLLGLYILISIINVGSAGGIPRVILSALLMLIGVQIVLFGFLADMLKK